MTMTQVPQVRRREHLARPQLPDPNTVSDKAISDAIREVETLKASEREVRTRVRDLTAGRTAAANADNAALADWHSAGRKGARPSETEREELEGKIRETQRDSEAVGTALDRAIAGLVTTLRARGPGYGGKLEREREAARAAYALAVEELDRTRADVVAVDGLISWIGRPEPGATAALAGTGQLRTVRNFSTGPGRLGTDNLERRARPWTELIGLLREEASPPSEQIPTEVRVHGEGEGPAMRATS
jgi:hypothetical protein